MNTIRIKSPISDDNPTGFIVINVSDFNADEHEPFDDEARDALAGAVLDHVPTVAELLTARDQLSQERADMDAERERLAEQAAAQDEAQRALDAATAAAAAASAASEQAAALTVAQLRDALTARGIPFDASAKKADLQALLDAAAA